MRQIDYPLAKRLAVGGANASQAPTEGHHDVDGALGYPLRLPLEDTNRYLTDAKKMLCHRKAGLAQR